MLTIARVFVGLFFGAVLLVGSGVVAPADGGPPTSVENPMVDTAAIGDSAELRVDSPADCDGAGVCSERCGSASCPVGAFAVPTAGVFGASPRARFSEARNRLLTQRTLAGLLRPPTANFI